MKLTNLLLIMTLVMLVSCSGKKKTQDVEEDLAESVILSDEENSELGDLEELDGVEVVDEPVQEQVIEETAPAVVEEMANIDSAPEPVINEMGEIQNYVVNKGDSLMWIAFKVYGDYTKWREIARQNPGIDYNNLREGMTVRHQAPAVKFVWQPNGDPYLIKNGDTLGRISNNVYGSQKNWKDIWQNNKPLIKDPNVIFAGFTIYYLPADQLASF